MAGRWRKGESGNPNGRPKSVFSFSSELRSQLAEVNPRDRRGRTHGQIIVSKAIYLAEQGSIRAINEIVDRLEGKPAQALTLDARISSAEERAANILQNVALLRPLQTDGSDSKPN